MARYTVKSLKDSADTTSQPILRETMTIMVEGKPVTVYKDEFEKQLYSSLLPHLYPSAFDYGA